MAHEMSNRRKGPHDNAYARTRTEFVKISFIFLAISIPAFAAVDAGFTAAVAALQKTDLKTRYDGLEKIKTFRTPEAAQAVVRSALSERDANFRLAALDQIAAFQLNVVVPDLAPFLNDKSAAVRQRAARVIGILGGPSGETLLAPAAAKETDPSVRAAVIQSLGLCGSAKSDGILSAAAAGDTDAAVRANAQHARQRIKAQRG